MVEILNLGDYWDEKGIKANKEDILKVNKEVGKMFNRAYKYLRASKYIYDDIYEINEEAVNLAGVNIEVDKIIKEVFNDRRISGKLGIVRKLFASAITPNGLVNYLDNLISGYEQVYSFNGFIGSGISNILHRIEEESIMRGLNVESFYCPMDPEQKIEHLVIPELSIAFITNNKYHKIAVIDSVKIDMNNYINENKLKEHKEILDYNTKTFDGLLDKTIETISKAKKLHDYMESFYIPYMDFESENICFQKTLNQLLEYSK